MRSGQAKGGYLGGHWRLLSISFAAFLALAACTSATQTPATTPPSTASSPSTASPVQGSAKVSLPLDFRVQLYQGQDILGAKELKFSTFVAKGQPVVLNFFAGLCPPCRAEMPDFEAVSAAYQGKVNFFGLDVGPFVGLGSREDGKDLVEELGVTYPTGTTQEGKVVQIYRVLGMPTSVFITPEGKVTRIWNGLLNRQKLKDLTEELLRKSVRPGS